MLQTGSAFIGGLFIYSIYSKFMARKIKQRQSVEIDFEVEDASNEEEIRKAFLKRVSAEGIYRLFDEVIRLKEVVKGLEEKIAGLESEK